MSKSTSKPEPLNADTLNPCLLKAEYAVRGAIAVKGQDYQRALQQGAELPFKKVIACNIGKCDPQNIPRSKGLRVFTNPLLLWFRFPSDLVNLLYYR